MPPQTVPSIYLMRVKRRGSDYRSLWQVRGDDAICINADDEVRWMQGRRFIDVLQRCVDERLTMEWTDADGY